MTAHLVIAQMKLPCPVGKEQKNSISNLLITRGMIPEDRVGILKMVEELYKGTSVEPKGVAFIYSDAILYRQ